MSNIYLNPENFILASGKGWLAINKPSGITVHNEPGKDVCSIIQKLIKEDRLLEEKVVPDLNFGIHPVHRLDKETSGILLMAATQDVLSDLSGQFNSRKIRKYYIALLHGSLSLPESDNGWGIWKWPLSKSAGGRQNPRGTGKKLPSETRYKILKITDKYTLVDIEIMSGRTHQIRRHAKLAGHPVVGDARYGSKRAIRFLKENHNFNRLGLHAQSITFHTPDKKTDITIQTSGIPEEIQKLIQLD